MKPFWWAALCLGAVRVICAQSPAQSSPQSPFDRPVPSRAIQIESPATGSLAGRLTDLRSAPLAGVNIVLRNQLTGAEARATTGRNGAFRFASLDAGAYTLEADAAELGHGSLEGIVVSGGTEARVQAAIRFEPPAPSLLEAAAPNAIVQPASAALLPLKPSALANSPGPANAAIARPISSPQPADAESASEPRPPAAGAKPAAASGPPVLAMNPGAAKPAPPPSAANAAGGAFAPLLSLSRPALSTSSAECSARIEPETVRRIALAAREAPIAKPAQPNAPASTVPLARQSIIPAQPQAQIAAEKAVLAAAMQRRAALETQSVPLQLALAAPLPKAFPLPASPAPVAAVAAVATNMDAAIQSVAPQAPVAAAAQRVDPVTPAVATTITSGQLQALPASGRRWEEFQLDTPAASASAGASQTSLRGAQEPAEVTIDGAGTRLAFGVAAGAPSRSPESDPTAQDADEKGAASPVWNGGRGFGVSEAAVREVTTAAGNAEAESVRSAGGRTAIRTQSGADSLHGQGFLFDRQNNWGARNPFTQWVTETSEVAPLAPYNTTSFPVFDNFQYSSGLPGPPQSYTPPDHEIVWGLGMGSRIRRDKLFWFAALDSYRRNNPAVSMVKHPYLQPPCETPPCSPTGFFAAPSDAQLQLLSAQLDSSGGVAGGLTAYSQMLESLGTLLGPAPRTAMQWLGFGRLDWQATERQRFTLEATGADWNAPGGGLTRTSENYGSSSFGSSQANQEWILARWEAFLTPNLLAATQGSVGRAILSAHAEPPSSFEGAFLHGQGNIYGQLPQIGVDSRYGFTIGNPARFGQGSYPDERMVHAQQMLDWAHNKLLVRTGFELDHNSDATSMLRNAAGTFSYSKVQNFIADALTLEKYGPNPSGPQNNTMAWHNCDQTGKPWYAASGQLMGLGALPCYSFFSQTVGPTNWHLSTNDWAGYVTAQWQPNKIAVISAGMRWEREQLPPPIASVANPNLTNATLASPGPALAANPPNLGNNWGPRVSLAIGGPHGRLPVLRMGYGMYYGRVANATIETALTQTGSFNGDLSFFIRPTDGLNPINMTSAAPFFPDVLQGPASSVVVPGAVGFAPNFRNSEVHQAVVGVEQQLPGRVLVTADAMLSLGRRLPITIDQNLNVPTSKQTITFDVCDQTPATPPGSNNTSGKCGNMGLGPIKATQITIPFYASWPSGDCSAGSKLNAAGQCGRLNPNYQQISEIASRANSTYEAAMVRISREGRGLSLRAHYTYAHAMDWNPNETTLSAGSDVLDPNPLDFKYEYGTSNLDVRHSAAVMAIFTAPWKLHDLAGRLANGWVLSGIAQFHSGLPYTMRTSGSLATMFDNSGNAIVGLAPGINGSGGDNRVYGSGSDGVVYNIGRNTFRYPATWKADLRLAKRFDLGEMRRLELLVESFNLFNHQNVTGLETTGYFIESGSPTSPGAAGTLPTLNFLTGLKVNPTTGLASPAFGQPLGINTTNFYRERQIELGLRMQF